MSKMATIKGVSIKNDDIVKVKFKPLGEIIELYEQEGWSPSSFLDESEIDTHLSALLSGGYFKVSDIMTGEDERYFPQLNNKARGSYKLMPEEISIDNHLTNNGDEFTFNENIVEEITVEHDAADMYFSEKFKMNIMKINGALYINNELVTKEDAKLIDILESAVSDLAIQKMLSESEVAN